MKKAHNKIKEYFSSLDGIESVSEVIELPNKYGDNTSSFTLKYNYKDEYNFTVLDFNVHWDKKELFVRCHGYFPFENESDLIEKVTEYLN
jgi:hypothetical protein